MAPSAYRLSVCGACRAATASPRKDARTAASQSEAASSAQRRAVSQSEAPELPSLCPTVAELYHIYKVVTVNKDEQSCNVVDMFNHRPPFHTEMCLCTARTRAHRSKVKEINNTVT